MRSGLAMLRACMIDGFGWFQPADYRRTWLFFDDVDYVLPRPGSGPLFYSAWVTSMPECRAVFPELDKEAGEQILATARGDAADPEFRAFVGQNIPAHDREYAANVVRMYHDIAELADPLDPVLAISVLLNRLLFYSAQIDAVPIVGRKYAATLLRRKLDRWRELGESNHPIATRSQGQLYTAIAVGISFDFIPDAELEQVQFDHLAGFKSKHADLLRRNQLHVLKTAQEYRGLAEGSEFEEKLAALRVSALEEQQKLQDEACQSWWEAGVGLAKKAITNLAAGSAAAGIAVLRSNSFHDIVLAAAPAVAAALGVAVASGMDVLKKERELKKTSLAYMLDARSFLAANRQPA